MVRVISPVLGFIKYFNFNIQTEDKSFELSTITLLKKILHLWSYQDLINARHTHIQY